MTKATELLSEDTAKEETSLRYMLKIAGPMIIATSSYTLMQFVDRMMVSHYSEDAIAAILPASMVSFIPASFALGVMTTVNTFVSQSLGRGSKRDCSNYFWQAVYMGLLYSAVTFSFMWPTASRIFRIMSQPESIIGLEVTYFRIMILSQFVVILMWATNHFFMGIHRPVISMYTAVISQVVNVIANYVLIFGKFGFPEMGLAGAGWGTLIGSVVGAVLRMSVFLGKGINSEFRSRRSLKIDFTKMLSLLKIGSAAGFAFMINTALLGAILFRLIGGFGKEALAATSAVYSCTALSFMPAVGVSIALTAAVGKSIGKKRKDIAVKQTSVCLKISLLYMGIVGTLFFIFRHQIIAVWKLGETATDIGAKVLICAAIFQVFDAAVLTYSGALRGAGDTLWLGFISAVGALLVLGGGGWLIVKLFPTLGAIGPWIAYTFHIIIVGIADRWRFKSNKWMRIDLFKRRPAGLPTEIEPLIE